MSGASGSRTAAGAPAQRAEPAEPLRLAFVMPPWFDVPPDAYGGIESVVADLIDALIERGHQVSMVGAGETGTDAEFRRTYTVAPSERIGEALPEVVHAAVASRYLDQIEVDVIHDHSLAGPLAARGRTAPTVVTTHGPLTGEMAHYYRAISPDVSLVAISDSQRRLEPDLRWAATVHNAINVATFTFTDRKDDHVLFIGRMSPDKGAHLAIDAARAAGRRIVLAGKLQEPVEREYFEAEVQPRLGNDAEFIGEADTASKQELYGSPSCLVFPICWEEPFGLVMIEAMACGTPVVALRRGSVPEVVLDGTTGFVRDDPAELPAAINETSRIDPAACRRHVEENFGIAVMTAGYERTYRAVRAAGIPTPAR
jgi:glycosyltransferase involved in cell wall biosynthesis